MSIKLEPENPETNTLHSFDQKEKKQLLKQLKQADGNAIQMLHSFSSEKQALIRDFFLIKANESLKLVAEESCSHYFSEADQLLNDILNDSETLPDGSQDIALVLKTIANTEAHPDPDEIGGIDLKSLYSTLSLLAMGYPVEELNEPTSMFLAECVDNLRSNIKSPSGAVEVTCNSKLGKRNRPNGNDEDADETHFTITMLD